MPISTRSRSTTTVAHASRARIAASLGLDAAAVIACGAVAGLALGGDTPVVAALVGATASAIALVAWRSTTGGSLGHVVLRLRTVWDASGMPAAPWHRPRTTVDVRGRVDPLRLQPTAIALDAAAEVGVEPERVDRLVVTVDDGSRTTVMHAAVVGRDPSLPSDPSHSVLVIPDLGRTISRSHALLEVDARGAHLTDLSSEHGTRVQGVALAPRVRTPVPWGAVVELGERRIRIDRRAHPTEGAA